MEKPKHHNKPTNEMTNRCTQVYNTPISGKFGIRLPVVRVWIYHTSNPHKRISTMALMDSCSRGSFIHEELMSELNLSGLQTSVQFTVYSNNQNHDWRTKTDLQRCNRTGGLTTS